MVGILSLQAKGNGFAAVFHVELVGLDTRDQLVNRARRNLDNGLIEHQLQTVDAISRQYILVRFGIHVEYFQRVDVFDQAFTGFAVQRVAVADDVELERNAVQHMCQQAAEQNQQDRGVNHDERAQYVLRLADR